MALHWRRFAENFAQDCIEKMSDIFDVAVIGGGINGAGIARDAAGRGAKVLLLESGDLAQGTSSASTKLIHGGLRYLEHYEFGLVRESLAEREVLWRIAPHIVHPLRFVLPHVDGLRPRWLIRLGLLIYDHIGGRKALPATRTIDLRVHQSGNPLKDGFRTGFEYSDCWVDDARLVVLNALDAAERGAAVKTRSLVTSAHREDGRWRILAGSKLYEAKALVNAAGPRALEMDSVAGESPCFAMRLVRGSHIVVRRHFDHDYAYFFQLADGRIFFAIPYEKRYTLVGTTDVDHDGALDKVEASAEEIAYLCEGASHFFSNVIEPKDVVWTYSGVRPLIRERDGKPEAATRGYRLDLSPTTQGPPLLSIYGGKITTYRHLSEAAVDLLSSRLPALAGNKGWTANCTLPGGDFAIDGLAALIADLRQEFRFLSPDQADRVARAYGTRARLWLSQEQGADFGAGLRQAEVDYLVANEWARTAEDILWRRTKLGLGMDAEQQMALTLYLQCRNG